MNNIDKRDTNKEKEFWDNIEVWTDPSIVNAELCGNTPHHKKMYEECQRYDKWTHSFSKDFSEELKYNIATLSGSPTARWDAIQEKWAIYGSDAAPAGDWQYFWTLPKKEDFPTIHEFMEQNTQYKNPVVAKLGPSEKILVHDHGPAPQFLYNMSINEPESSKMAIYPTGVIPYKPGDIYKLYVHNKHAVINGNEDRYHLMFRGGRIEQETSPIQET
jgi:hypothetical protein